MDCNQFAYLNKDEMCGKCEEERRKDADARCGVCRMPVRDEDNGVECEKCTLCFHAGCGDVSLAQYRTIEKEQAPWSCKNCMMKARLHESKEVKEAVGENARSRPNHSLTAENNIEAPQVHTTYILCDGCGSERRADEFVDCTVCLVKSENLALRIQIKECQEGMIQMQEIFSKKFREMQENFDKLRQDLSIKKKVREEPEPAKNPDQSGRKNPQVEQIQTKTMKETTVPTRNQFILLQDELDKKKPAVGSRQVQEKREPKPNNKEHRGPIKLTPRIIVGDSMVRNMRKHIKLDAEGSKNIC